MRRCRSVAAPCRARKSDSIEAVTRLCGQPHLVASLAKAGGAGGILAAPLHIVEVNGDVQSTTASFNARKGKGLNVSSQEFVSKAGWVVPASS